VTRQREVRHAVRRTHLLGLAADGPFTSWRIAVVRLLDSIGPAKKAALRAMMDVR
jgi:hypothetical protein